MRVLAWLLAIIMMTGTAAQVCASPDTAASIEDAPDLVMPATPEPVAVARPVYRPVVQIEASRAPSLGRVHAVAIFRPPR